jgi:hypothetical protein
VKCFGARIVPLMSWLATAAWYSRRLARQIQVSKNTA